VVDPDGHIAQCLPQEHCGGSEVGRSPQVVGTN
jgi:hypothetical protein